MGQSTLARFGPLPGVLSRLSSLLICCTRTPPSTIDSHVAHFPDKPLAQQVRDAGLDNMLRVPGAGDEADPVEVVRAASDRLNAALKEIAAAEERAASGEEEERHVTGEEVVKMGGDLNKALQATLAADSKATTERLNVLTLNGDRLVLPAGDTLASKVGIVRSETDAALLFRILYRAQRYPRICVQHDTLPALHQASQLDVQ